MGLRRNIVNFLWHARPRRFRLEAHRTARIRDARVEGGEGCIVVVSEYTTLKCRIHFPRGQGVVSVGARSIINESILICADRISIGDDVMIAWDVTVFDNDSHSVTFRHREDDVINWRDGRQDWSHVPVAPITIGDKVWIGFGAAIAKGVTVGEGAVIAARAMVTKDVPPWTVVAGNPARVVRELSDDERRLM
jgi:galactoside O-acetyltransferase